MKFLKQFLIILVITFMGEGLKYLLHGSPVSCFDDGNRQIGIGA